MKSKLIKNPIFVALGLIASALFSFFFITSCSDLADRKNTAFSPEYVGRSACIECHQKEYHDWKGSDHDLAMDVANDSTVLGDFNNALLEREGQTHKAYKKDSLFYVYTDGEDGNMHEYLVKYVFGHYPLQNYLVEFPGGRLQTLALTWNSKDHNWFYMADSVYKNMSVTHTNWLHWTNQAQNWNSMCADCHSTNLKKNYNPQTNSYHTTWSEIDVSCEACHGPGSEHLQWAKKSEKARGKITNYALAVKTSGLNNKQYVDNCARCHARRSNFSDYDAKSNHIYNYIEPSLPMEPNWYIDGQIRSEDYVYGSFTQSKMYMHDVQCNNCHNVHSGKLRFQGNKLCHQCHLSKDYDVPAHTHHKGYGEKGEGLVSAAGVKFEVGSGTQCINCHMHGQNFMGVDYRRDHSFRVPRPDLSDKLGTPNACNQCHTDKSNQWAANNIVKWFGESRHFQYGEAFNEAKTSSPHADVDLRNIFIDSLYSAPIRSVALTMLVNNTDTNNNLLMHALTNREPSIRLAAVRRMNLNSQESLNRLSRLLNDSLKAVRLAAYQRIREVDTSLLSASQKTALQKVDSENYQVLLFNSDFPVGKYNLANYYALKGKNKEAEKMYLAALQQDTELSPARMNLAHLYSVMGMAQKAEEQLKRYVNENPNDGAGYYNYGLILSENKKYQQSLTNLLKASELSPENERIDFNIAMLYEFFGQQEKAEKYLIQSIDKRPELLDSYLALLKFYMRSNQPEKIKRLINETVHRFPDKQSIARIRSAVSKN